jgi:hypothetical protein
MSAASHGNTTGAHDEEAKAPHTKSEQATQSLYTKIIMRKTVSMEDS